MTKPEGVPEINRNNDDMQEIPGLQEHTFEKTTNKIPPPAGPLDINNLPGSTPLTEEIENTNNNHTKQ